MFGTDGRYVIAGSLPGKDRDQVAQLGDRGDSLARRHELSGRSTRHVSVPS
jgi:hypothetical protein